MSKLYPSDILRMPEKKRPAAYAKLLGQGSHYQDSLDLRMAAGMTLTAEQIASAMELFGKGCRRATKEELLRALRSVPCIIGHSIYRRVLIEGDVVRYCAGQDYPSEVALVRNLLVGRSG